MKKRELTLVDKSGSSVRLTLWGNQAENFSPEEQYPVIAFKGVKVGDFNGSVICLCRSEPQANFFLGRSLGMVSSSIMTQNPDIPESHALRGWYDSGGSDVSFQPQTSTGTYSGGTGGGGFNRSEIKPLLDMKLEANRIPDSDEKPLFFSTRATVMHIRGDNIAYAACETCNKKVIEEGAGWKCEKCDKTWPQPCYR